VTNTSATGGFLAPTSTAPIEDDALDDFLQGLVVGITGLPGTLVRPRWQPGSPKQPEPSTDWCAIGVTDEDADENAAVIHHSDGDGFDEVRRHEVLTILASFYGPNSRGNAKLFRDGLQVAQNRETLFLQSAGLVDVSRMVAAPELTNQQWVKRVDLPFRIRRAVTRTYPVENLVNGVGDIRTQQGETQGDTDWDSQRAPENEDYIYGG
jgi:hypothetical protein